MQQRWILVKSKAAYPFEIFSLEMVVATITDNIPSWLRDLQITIQLLALSIETWVRAGSQMHQTHSM
jgi:hypothetical protein